MSVGENEEEYVVSNFGRRRILLRILLIFTIT